MRRIASLAVMLTTAYFLIATSQAPCTATAESLSFTSRTTCGPDTAETVSITTSCAVTLSDRSAGLPPSGTAWGSGGGLLRHTVYLSSLADAGTDRACTLTPNDAGTGFDVSCSSDCTEDAGCTGCTGVLAL